MNMKLIPINDDNKAAVLGLSSRDDQPFCVPNEYSLEQAEECNAECPGVARPFAIYAEDQLVGFCMFAFDLEEEDPDERYWLWRFMIDERYQAKGLGKQALAEALAYLKTGPVGAGKGCWLSYEPENTVARDLYRKFGFEENGEMCGDEVVAYLPFTE